MSFYRLVLNGSSLVGKVVDVFNSFSVNTGQPVFHLRLVHLAVHKIFGSLIRIVPLVSERNIIAVYR